MAIKFDLEMVYDKLEWSFIRQTLMFFEFSFVGLNSLYI